MKHVSRISKRTPAMAAASGILTNKNNPTPGLFGMNEPGDAVLWLGATLQGLAGGFLPLMPTGIAKSGAGLTD